VKSISALAFGSRETAASLVSLVMSTATGDFATMRAAADDFDDCAANK
jgi:hypothetical protein